MGFREYQRPGSEAEAEGRVRERGSGRVSEGARLIRETSLCQLNCRKKSARECLEMAVLFVFTRWIHQPSTRTTSLKPYNFYPAFIPRLISSSALSSTFLQQLSTAFYPSANKPTHRPHPISSLTSWASSIKSRTNTRSGRLKNTPSVGRP